METNVSIQSNCLTKYWNSFMQSLSPYAELYQKYMQILIEARSISKVETFWAPEW